MPGNAEHTSGLRLACEGGRPVRRLKTVWTALLHAQGCHVLLEACLPMKMSEVYCQERIHRTFESVSPMRVVLSQKNEELRAFASRPPSRIKVVVRQHRRLRRSCSTRTWEQLTSKFIPALHISMSEQFHQYRSHYYQQMPCRSSSSLLNVLNRPMLII
jgi:hypothetical protein